MVCQNESCNLWKKGDARESLGYLATRRRRGVDDCIITSAGLCTPIYEGGREKINIKKQKAGCLPPLVSFVRSFV